MSAFTSVLPVHIVGGLPSHPPENRTILRLDHSVQGPYTTVIRALGDIDASNAHRMAAYIRHVMTAHHTVVVDLRGVGFIGNIGISTLLRINDALIAPYRMAVVPSSAVARVLRLYPPLPALAIADDIGAALAGMAGPLRSPLRLLAAPD